MSRFVILFILIFICSNLHAQRDTVWVNHGLFGLKMTQVSLSSWSAGGESAIAFDAQAMYSADYKRGKSLWQNRIELAYGLTRTKDKGARKSNDKIYLASTYGYEVYRSLYVSTIFNFTSQFAKGYDYEQEEKSFISKFMSPGYVLLGIGLTWNPNKHFTLTVAPSTWRGTVVANKRLADEGAYGVKEGRHILSEYGATMKAEANYEFMENMKIYSRLELYSDYLRQPQNIDINWEVQLNMIINKWFSATLSTNLLYDNDVKIAQTDGTSGPRVQFKEVLGVGLQFNF